MWSPVCRNSRLTWGSKPSSRHGSTADRLMIYFADDLGDPRVQNLQNVQKARSAFKGDPRNKPRSQDQPMRITVDRRSHTCRTGGLRAQRARLTSSDGQLYDLYDTFAFGSDARHGHSSHISLQSVSLSLSGGLTKLGIAVAITNFRST